MRDIEYGAYEIQLVALLNNKVKGSLVLEDFMEWMEPIGDTTGDLEKFDKAVTEFLGEDLYSKLDSCARLIQGLAWKLGIGDSVSGGIDFKKL
jgi:hypothetical protein